MPMFNYVGLIFKEKLYIQLKYLTEQQTLSAPLMFRKATFSILFHL